MKIQLNKKDVSRYKLLLKKMLTCVSKFGISKEKDDTVWLYHYIRKTDRVIFPVVFLFHEKNPWGDEYYPSRLFITCNDIPDDINVFDTSSNNEDYFITLSYSINVSKFRKEVIDCMKELSLTVNTDGSVDVDVDFISSSSDTDNYVDKVLDYKSIASVVKSTKPFSSIDDVDKLSHMHDKLVEETQVSIDTDNGNILKLFFPISPLKLYRFDYKRIMNVHDNNVISTVYCKQYLDNVIINNFYRYIDIWNLKIGEKHG